ncbi:MAG: hypothetical protein RL341_1038 [Pseudomonadota bacterium]|jgi:hypothetical protein
MNHFKVVAATGLLLFCVSAFAQQLKPGLWEMQHRMQGDAEMNAQMEQARKQLAAMPPAQRKQMEEMMAKQGVKMDFGAGSSAVTAQVCLTEEDVKRDMMPTDMQGKCKYDWKKSGSTVRSTFTCTDPVSSGSGEWTLVSAERYTMKMDATSQDKAGKPRAMKMSGEGKWLGADCKGLVPLGKKK